MRFLVLMAAVAFLGCDVAGKPARGRTEVKFQSGTPVADNTPVDFTVTVRDAEGHVVKDVPVFYASPDEGVTFTGDGDKTGKDGVVNGTIASTKSGEKTLNVTVAEGEIAIKLKPETVTFMPGTPANLSFFAQPTLTRAGIPISPAVVVEVTDANGNRATNSVYTAYLTLVRSTGGEVLNGGTAQQMVESVEGLITFDNLIINKPQAGYALRAQTTPTGSGVSAESAQFDVQIGDFTGSTSSLTTTPMNQQVNVNIALDLIAHDAGGNGLEGLQATFSVTPGTGCQFVDVGGGGANVATTGSMGVAPSRYLTCSTVGARTVTATIGDGSISKDVYFY